MPLISQDTGIPRQVLEVEKKRKSRLHQLLGIKLTKSLHIIFIQMESLQKKQSRTDQVYL